MSSQLLSDIHCRIEEKEDLEWKCAPEFAFLHDVMQVSSNGRIDS
jgi:hypothetical protein